MSPQFTIITAAMSLGGMASVGFSHYGQVEKEIADYHSEQKEEEIQLEVAQVGEQVESSFAEMEEKFRLEREKDREGFNAVLADVAAKVEMISQKQGADQVLLEKLSRDQDTLDFKVHSMSEGFRPLRSSEGRFQPLGSSESGANHPLLPPVEDSWKQQY